MSDDFLQRLKEDIPKTGFVTEMVVASILNKAGWTAVDHPFYVDKDENKGREIDVAAIKVSEAADGQKKKKITLTLALAIEIKKATNKPWVIFSSPKASVENVEAMFDTSLVHMNTQEIWFKDLYANHPIATCGRFGRVAYQAFKKKAAPGDVDPVKDEGYGIPTFGAFASCFKGAIELSGYMRQAEQSPLRDPATQVKSYAVGISHGLLVIDGRLFEARVTSQTDIDLNEVHWLPYTFNYASKEYGNRRFLVDVVTIGYLPTYLTRYQEWLDERARFCLAELS